MHSHCVNCIKIRKCNVRPTPDHSCEIIECPLSCGALFHACKLDEHRLLCFNELVDCLNSNYGCPFKPFRRQMVKHLQVCPANVVHCTVEWNRWPLHTIDKRLTQPIVSQSMDINHLDVALTLRDQRMLKQLWSASRRKRTALRNRLTRKYPAVPFKPYYGISASESMESSSPTSPTTCVPPLVTASDDDSDSSPWQMHNVPPGLQSSVCARLGECDVTTRAASEVVTDVTESKLNQEAPLNGLVNQLSSAIPTPPAIPQCIGLSLDLNVDAIAPYQPKPKLMYTFRCAQEFRRDEYQKHYKNVHSDIQGSINGWMEQRCPLWQYGCNFAQRRLHPEPPGSKIVFNSVVESFGLHLQPECSLPTQNQQISLEMLPFEVLQEICKSLDGFSLNNVSLTCKRLRDVCATLLETRGVVVLQWERKKSDDGCLKWDIGCKRWFFSTCFTPVEKWTLDGSESVLNHLKSCPFYEKVIKTEPFKLPTLIREQESKKKI